ncbi:JmjC domain-containing protein [Streptomyces sp. NPDC056347]|uniref:JmjC domain-containing protein n=1 Tax=Streptomyces sp. NPDC056347 TaxID=3345790 RepID=UPI0035DC222E
MASADPLEQASFDLDLFLSTYWRRQPLFVRGGAKELLRRSWTDADFDAALVRARSEHAVKERSGEVEFIEQVSRFDENLQRQAAKFSTVFGAPQVWFDSVRTRSASGIGAHFDHSDNFVLQQTGTKEWKLAAPSHVEKRDIVRRMMNLPGAGKHTLPEDDCVQFTVRPGDLLYIPLFWPHSGVSHEESLSLSLVCPAVSLYSAVLPALTKVLRSRGIGYQPIPALHSGLSPQERAAADAALAKATRTLLKGLSDDAVVDAVLAIQTDRLLLP